MMIRDVAPAPRGRLTIDLMSAGGEVIRSLPGPNRCLDALAAAQAGWAAGIGDPITEGGFGTNPAEPLLTDTGLADAILVPAVASVSGRVTTAVFTLPAHAGNGLTIVEYGLWAGNRLICRTTRPAVAKGDWFALRATWTITFITGS